MKGNASTSLMKTLISKRPCTLSSNSISSNEINALKTLNHPESFLENILYPEIACKSLSRGSKKDNKLKGITSINAPSIRTSPTLDDTELQSDSSLLLESLSSSSLNKAQLSPSSESSVDIGSIGAKFALTMLGLNNPNIINKNLFQRVKQLTNITNSSSNNDTKQIKKSSINLTTTEVNGDDFFLVNNLTINSFNNKINDSNTSDQSYIFENLMEEESAIKSKNDDNEIQFLVNNNIEKNTTMTIVDNEKLITLNEKDKNLDINYNGDGQLEYKSSDRENFLLKRLLSQGSTKSINSLDENKINDQIKQKNINLNDSNKKRKNSLKELEMMEEVPEKIFKGSNSTGSMRELELNDENSRQRSSLEKILFRNESTGSIKNKDDIILRALLNTSDLEPQVLQLESVFDLNNSKKSSIRTTLTGTATAAILAENNNFKYFKSISLEKEPKQFVKTDKDLKDSDKNQKGHVASKNSKRKKLDKNKDFFNALNNDKLENSLDEVLSSKLQHSSNTTDNNFLIEIKKEKNGNDDKSTVQNIDERLLCKFDFKSEASCSDNQKFNQIVCSSAPVNNNNINSMQSRMSAVNPDNNCNFLSEPNILNKSSSFNFELAQDGSLNTKNEPILYMEARAIETQGDLNDSKKNILLMPSLNEDDIMINELEQVFKNESDRIGQLNTPTNPSKSGQTKILSRDINNQVAVQPFFEKYDENLIQSKTELLKLNDNSNNYEKFKCSSNINSFSNSNHLISSFSPLGLKLNTTSSLRINNDSDSFNKDDDLTKQKRIEAISKHLKSDLIESFKSITSLNIESDFSSKKQKLGNSADDQHSARENFYEPRYENNPFSKDNQIKITGTLITDDNFVPNLTIEPNNHQRLGFEYEPVNLNILQSNKTFSTDLMNMTDLNDDILINEKNDLSIGNLSSNSFYKSNACLSGVVNHQNTMRKRLQEHLQQKKAAASILINNNTINSCNNINAINQAQINISGSPNIAIVSPVVSSNQNVQSTNYINATGKEHYSSRVNTSMINTFGKMMNPTPIVHGSQIPSNNYEYNNAFPTELSSHHRNNFNMEPHIITQNPHSLAPTTTTTTVTVTTQHYPATYSALNKSKTESNLQIGQNVVTTYNNIEEVLSN